MCFPLVVSISKRERKKCFNKRRRKIVKYVLKYLTTFPQIHRPYSGINIVTCRGEYQRGFRLDIGFIDQL
jgi:hypothetical protein